jgi:hypothetical protein
MTQLPTPYAAARIAAYLSEHLCWSAFWDKKRGVWHVCQRTLGTGRQRAAIWPSLGSFSWPSSHVAEDDPDSDLHAESPDASAVIAYMKSHS